MNKSLFCAFCILFAVFSGLIYDAAADEMEDSLFILPKEYWDEYRTTLGLVSDQDDAAFKTIDEWYVPASVYQRLVAGVSVMSSISVDVKTLSVMVGSTLYSTTPDSGFVNITSSGKVGYRTLSVQAASNVNLDSYALAFEKMNLSFAGYRWPESDISFFSMSTGTNTVVTLSRMGKVDSVPYPLWTGSGSGKIFTIRFKETDISLNSGQYTYAADVGFATFEKTDLKLDEINKSVKDQTEQDKKHHEENKGFFQSIISGITNLPKLIGDMLYNVFVPSDDYFTNKITEVSEGIEEHLGFIGYPISKVLDLFNAISKIGPGAPSGVISIPSFTLDFAGYTFPGASMTLSVNGFMAAFGIDSQYRPFIQFLFQTMRAMNAVALAFVCFRAAKRFVQKHLGGLNDEEIDVLGDEQ